MKPETEKLLAKASRAIDAAILLVEAGNVDFAAGRAYYAMFYVAEALLAEKGRRLSKHSAVHAAYGEEFAKTAVLDPQFHRWLLDASDKRFLGDYGVEASLTPDDVRIMLEHARAFLTVASYYLSSRGIGRSKATPMGAAQHVHHHRQRVALMTLDAVFTEWLYERTPSGSD